MLGVSKLKGAGGARGSNEAFPEDFVFR